ncbi:coiled-coil domain-containing protein 112-like [Xyrauchen texanus]|uniref:coiled-coil domain-containing protein 112-like n=1 Tax=Xyrauchen texanus TaxID=154827 RepID=UPI002242527B|nr:coiled-coil domain-containing protein 112-like [Xyrauchen texanus]
MSIADFQRETERLRKLLCKHNRETHRIHDLKETFSVFEEFENKLQIELQSDILKVQQQLQKMKNCVYRFQVQLTDVKPSPDLIDKLKDTMTDIENSINMFKDSQYQSFEELLKEETTVWQEVNALEKKIDVWSLPVKADGLPRARSDKLSTDQKSSRNLLPEVTALEMFLQQRGGSQGGWDSYDHQSFMKVWTKHSGKPSYRKEAKFYLPDKTEEDIKVHEEWYLELCHLQDNKREAIQRWRAAKQREQDLQREQQNRDDVMEEQEETAAAQRLRQEQLRREASERLEAWRSRRKQQQEEAEEQRLRDEILRRRHATEERRRQLEVKLLVEERVRQKKQEEEQHLLEKEVQEQMEREERHKLAAENIKHFQERDSQRLEMKLQEKRSKHEEDCERQRKLAKLKEKVEVHVSRDPSRLWRATEGWKSRTKAVGPSGCGPVLHMFHRAVPTWRQDL